MDCQHIQQNELHENYLLGRLNEAEESEYEKHIEACDSCREELARQRLLIASIQAAGREEMKQQIRNQVAGLREHPVAFGSKWQMVLKIAAVLFIIALIPSAIYYFRTDSGEPIARLVKPESAPALEQRSAADKPAAGDDRAKNGTEETQLSAAAEAIDKETEDKDRYFADESLEKDELGAAAPKASEGKAASGGTGGGYGAAVTDANQDIPISILEESREATTAYQDELLSKLSQGARYKYAESENVKGGAVRFETKESAARKYDALQSQELLQDYRTGKQKGVEAEMLVSSAVFKSDQKLITVNFVPSNRELILQEGSNLPQSFDVDILDRDSADWKMNWYVDQFFIQHDPSQIEIVLNGQTLYVMIPKNNVYKIAAGADTTKAVLLER